MSGSAGARYDHVLIGLDGRAEGEHALAHGQALALRLGARVTVVGVTDADSEVLFWFTMDGAAPCDVDIWLAETAAAGQARVDAACARLRAAGLRARGESFHRGRLRQTVVERATCLGADLIVLSTPPRRGLAWLFPTWPDGPLTAPCPVVLVGPPGAPSDPTARPVERLVPSRVV